MLVENAISSINPSNKLSIKVKKPRPVLEQYIRYLLFNQMNENNFKLVANEMLKLPWKNPECDQ